MEPAPTDPEVLEALQGALRERGSAPARRLRRRPSEYRTSFPLERLEVELEDGEELQLAFKRLDWDGLDAGARVAKPQFLHDPRREPAVYGALLGPAAPGAPRYYGAAIEPERGRHWLFVEWVEGRELYQVGERGLWEEAARWLARFHSAHAPEAERALREQRLVDHDAAFYRRWIERARGFAQDPRSQVAPALVEWLAARHEQVAEVLLGLPRTVVHGEFYASNVLVAGDPGSARVAPVDWELAAVAPGLTDLAALVGGWAAPEREALIAAYADEPGSAGFTRRDLDFVRLQVAIQWLGWAPPEWEAPAGQRHDWAGEAAALAEELDLR